MGRPHPHACQSSAGQNLVLGISFSWSVKDSIRVAPAPGWVLTGARLRGSQVGRIAGQTQDPTEIRQMLPHYHRQHISVGEGGVSKNALLRVQKEPEGPGAWVAMGPGLWVYLTEPPFCRGQ